MNPLGLSALHHGVGAPAYRPRWTRKAGRECLERQRGRLWLTRPMPCKPPSTTMRERRLYRRAQPYTQRVNTYVQRLSPVIGQVEAFRYEASLRTHQNAIDRVETLNSRLSTLPFLDDADRKLLLQLDEEQAAAGKAFKAARVALDTALKRAKARDNEPDEKDGA